MIYIYLLWATDSSLLTDVECREAIERVLAAEKSAIRILKDFDSLGPELLKKIPRANASMKPPEEQYARRVTFATSRSKGSLVANKYQQALTDE